MKKIPGALLLSLLLPWPVSAALIGRYKMDASSGSQADTSGVSPAADAFPQGTGQLYQQADAPAGTYGSIQIPAGTITQSAGFPANVAAASTDHWLASTSPSPTVAAPARYNALLNNFTVMGWIKPATVTGTHRIFSTQVSGVTNHSWGFGVTTNKIRFTDYGQYDLDSTATPVTAGVWQHIAAVKSSTGGVQLYYNGALVHSDASRTAAVVATTTATTNWRLLNGPNNEIFAGLAAEIRVYDTALTQAEILTAAGHLAAPSGVLTNDFSPPNNPYLNFSHGTKDTATAASLTIFNTSAASSANKPANRLNDATDDFWAGKAPSSVSSIAFPSAGGALTDWIANNVYHAWSGGRTGFLTTRYTVQTTGFYDISAVWKSHTQAGAKAQVTAVLNGTALFTGTIDGFAGSTASGVAASGPSAAAAYIQPGFSLTAGDTLDLVTAPNAATAAGNLSLAVSVLPVPGPPVSTGTLVISEFVASNTSSYADEDGRYGDWIELYNGTGATIDLTGWSLSDLSTQPRKWYFPDGRTIAHGQFLVVFADNRDSEKRPSYNAASVLHTNFQLSAGGEYLGVINAAGNVVDAFTPVFPAQVSDIAYGRAGSAGPGIGFLIPTPGRVNGTTTSAPPGTIGFSVPAGVYTSTAPQSLTLTVNPAGQTIRYTTNNTEPTLSNGSTYTAPLNITTTTIVRARAFI
ncbi:MAG TPA: LamG-like jellyroll fold domain-containing protein, partial [Verrucomicrobiales bacterium]|nr:LamG-like jellyroll fold domain-containing protein [Verrucomicrobiales bacterium]